MDTIYKVLSFLDDKIKIIDAEPCEECGDYLTYEITTDKTLFVEYGWSTYEEGDSTDLLITFSDSITILKDNGGHSVYGDYENTQVIRFELEKEEEFLKWLNEEIL